MGKTFETTPRLMKSIIRLPAGKAATVRGMGFPLPPTPCRNVLLRHLCLAIGDPTVGEPPPNGLIEIAALRGHGLPDCRSRRAALDLGVLIEHAVCDEGNAGHQNARRTLPNLPELAIWSNASPASSAGKMRSMTGRSRPAASSGTTSWANAWTAFAFSSVVR